MFHYLRNLIIAILLAHNLISVKCSCNSGRSGQESDCYLNYMARENVIKMGMEGGCEMPKPQIVYPEDMMKMFMPRGTILHRCNDQAGCCPQKEYSCQAISEEEIKVAFYAINCNGGDTRPTPEYVMMKNHTRCQCQPKKDDMYDSQSVYGKMMPPQRLVNPICSGQSSYQSQSRYANQPYALSQVQQQPRSSPCSDSGSKPLINGQIVRGTIQVTLDMKKNGQPCPYGKK